MRSEEEIRKKIGELERILVGLDYRDAAFLAVLSQIIALRWVLGEEGL